LAFCTSFATCGTMLATPGWNIAVAAPLRNCSTTISTSDGEPARKATAVSACSPNRAKSASTIIRRAVNRSASTPPNNMHNATAASQAPSA
jgi:hypothetical protein